MNDVEIESSDWAVGDRVSRGRLLQNVKELFSRSAGDEWELVASSDGFDSTDIRSSPDFFCRIRRFGVRRNEQLSTLDRTVLVSIVTSRFERAVVMQRVSQKMNEFSEAFVIDFTSSSVSRISKQRTDIYEGEQIVTSTLMLQLAFRFEDLRYGT